MTYNLLIRYNVVVRYRSIRLGDEYYEVIGDDGVISIHAAAPAAFAAAHAYADEKDLSVCEEILVW